ncbi:MAG: TPM domain-containing protein [Caulobacter sp.]|nr:TPM domain-containing protein [Caulobacter sp.]
MVRALRGWLIGLALALLAAPVLAAPPTFPTLTGRVVDNAGLLSPAVEADLTRKLEGLQAATGRQLVVVTLPDLGGLEIEDYGYRLGRAWGLGEAKADNGALLIVAPNQRAVRIEVGYGLEPFLTDALSSVIINSAILPKFKAGDMQGGIVAGTDSLIQQLTLPVGEARAQVKAAEAPARASGGGGFPVWLFPIILFVIIVILSRLGGRGRRRSGLGAALPWILLNAATSSGGWSGRGNGGGWSGGGGGFSGGGGSFGGGGATGRW